MALEWQAYLEEATAALGGASARDVREELRAHLEQERQRLMAEDGLDAEQAAREAMRRLGAARALAAAWRQRRGPSWSRALASGAAAGLVGGAVWGIQFPLLLSRPYRTVIVYGGWYVLAVLGTLVAAAVIVAALTYAFRLVRYSPGRAPTELYVAVGATLAFTGMVPAVHVLDALLLGARLWPASAPPFTPLYPVMAFLLAGCAYALRWHHLRGEEAAPAISHAQP